MLSHLKREDITWRKHLEIWLSNWGTGLLLTLLALTVLAVVGAAWADACVLSEAQMKTPPPIELKAEA